MLSNVRQGITPNGLSVWYEWREARAHAGVMICRCVLLNKFTPFARDSSSEGTIG